MDTFLNSLSWGINYMLGFKPYVLLPIILLVLSVSFRTPLSKAVKSCLTIGVGFIGIFIVFDYFVANMSPAVQAMVKRTGLHFNVLDVGWPPLAALTWSFKLAPLLILLLIAVNVLMLVLKLTKVVNIDIWNFWHFIFLATLVYGSTESLLLSIAAALVSSVVSIKLADWSAPALKRFSGLSGVAITTLCATAYYPVGVLCNKLLDKVPFINKVDADPETIKKKLGMGGEPIVIGFVLGTLLGIGSGYDIKKILELGFQIGAVMYILPIMCGILGQGIMPISESIKEFFKKKFPDSSGLLIGLDVAIIVGNTSIIVPALLLMPVALLLAFTLPGVRFIPLGDLPNIMATIALVAVAVRGNVVRSFILGIPIIIGKLYAASFMAEIYTNLAHKSDFNFQGYDGPITGFLDGGNVLRYWLYEAFCGRLWALALVPVVGLVLYGTWRVCNVKR